MEHPIWSLAFATDKLLAQKERHESGKTDPKTDTHAKRKKTPFSGTNCKHRIEVVEKNPVDGLSSEEISAGFNCFIRADQEDTENARALRHEIDEGAGEMDDVAESNSQRLAHDNLEKLEQDNENYVESAEDQEWMGLEHRSEPSFSKLNGV